MLLFVVVVCWWDFMIMCLHLPSTMPKLVTFCSLECALYSIIQHFIQNVNLKLPNFMLEQPRGGPVAVGRRGRRVVLHHMCVNT